MNYDAAFKNIDDTLWKDAGCSSELDYIEQTSWVLFLKYLDDFESDKETAAVLNGESYTRIIAGDPAWVRASIDELGQRYGVDEFVVVSICHDFDARLRSYELLAREFNLLSN